MSPARPATPETPPAESRFAGDSASPGASGPRAERVNAAIERARAGDDEALSRLFTEVYDELHQLAHRQRRRWSGNHTLDTTSLVHESYLRLVDRRRFAFADLGHFFAVAARAMRHILIDYARRQRAHKRGGEHRRVDLDEAQAAAAASQETLVSLGAGIDQLAAIDARRARVFEYRFFLGLTVAETAEVLEVSPATVKRDWTLASSFLRVYLEG